MAYHRKPTDPKMLGRARQLRHDATSSERAVWGFVHDRRLEGLRIRRQHPIGPYVADFYCQEAALVLELDGMSHDESAEADAQPTRYLESLGLSVLRISNEDVLRDREAVAIAILRAAGFGPQ
jgi:very-short-patch-repair endonuclease